MEKQKTIKNTVTVKGVGLHTGKNVTVNFKPAPINHGYKFKRIDLPDSPIIDANIDYVVSTTRGTTLEHKGITIATTEHALAAVYGMDIDNIMIEIDSTEFPILDGSARFFVDALEKAEIVEQDAERVYYEINENITYTDTKNRIEIIAFPAENLKVTALIDFNSSVLGRQHATLHDIKLFKDEYAYSRTFVFLQELEYLLNNNLIKGGNIDNAIVISDREIEESEVEYLSKLFNKTKVDVKRIGILNAELRIQNEPARHKLLDLIGDLALVGYKIKGRIIATRPGHTANFEFGKKLKEIILKNKNKNKVATITPEFDIYKTPVYTIKDIQKILPHRPPFLLIDKILEIGDDYVVGLKNVTMNESFFVGHFPNEPIMPGVLQIEAMAQVGGIFALNTVSNPAEYLTLFLKINNVKFRNNVVPGDTVVFKLVLMSPIRRGICEMKGVAYVGNKIVTEGELLAQIIKKK